MTIEYILLLIISFGIGLKFFVSAPKTAFQKSGPMLAARIEQHLKTAPGFQKHNGDPFVWSADKEK